MTNYVEALKVFTCQICQYQFQATEPYPAPKGELCCEGCQIDLTTDYLEEK